MKVFQALGAGVMLYCHQQNDAEGAWLLPSAARKRMAYSWKALPTLTRFPTFVGPQSVTRTPYDAPSARAS